MFSSFLPSMLGVAAAAGCDWLLMIVESWVDKRKKAGLLSS
jgi:hypothetical protein